MSKNININCYVKVRLTEKGHDFLVKRHQETFGASIYKKPKEDLEGYSIWQLWVLIGIFGDALQFPTLTPPFEANIIVLDDED